MGTAGRIQRPICLKNLDDLICFDQNNVYVRLTETGLIYQVYIAAVPQALGRGKARPCPAQFDKGQPEGGKTANGQNFIPCVVK